MSTTTYINTRHGVAPMNNILFSCIFGCNSIKFTESNCQNGMVYLLCAKMLMCLRDFTVRIKECKQSSARAYSPEVIVKRLVEGQESATTERDNDMTTFDVTKKVYVKYPQASLATVINTLVGPTETMRTTFQQVGIDVNARNVEMALNILETPSTWEISDQISRVLVRSPRSNETWPVSEQTAYHIQYREHDSFGLQIAAQKVRDCYNAFRKARTFCTEIKAETDTLQHKLTFTQLASVLLRPRLTSRIYWEDIVENDYFMGGIENLELDWPDVKKEFIKHSHNVTKRMPHIAKSLETAINMHTNRKRQTNANQPTQKRRKT